jgi:hypothetical protein
MEPISTTETLAPCLSLSVLREQVKIYATENTRLASFASFRCTVHAMKVFALPGGPNFKTSIELRNGNSTGRNTRRA